MLAQITALGNKLSKYDKFFEEKQKALGNPTKTN